MSVCTSPARYIHPDRSGLSWQLTLPASSTYPIKRFVRGKDKYRIASRDRIPCAYTNHGGPSSQELRQLINGDGHNQCEETAQKVEPRAKTCCFDCLQSRATRTLAIMLRLGHMLCAKIKTTARIASSPSGDSTRFTFRDGVGGLAILKPANCVNYQCLLHGSANCDNFASIWYQSWDVGDV